MLLKIHARDFSLTNNLETFIDSKVRLVLGLYKEKIERVDVFLVDENGPKGGEDMRCKVKVKTQGNRPLVVHQTAEDMYRAIQLCLYRVRRTVGRRMDRIIRRKQHSVRLIE